MSFDSFISGSSEHLNKCSSSNKNNSPMTSTIINFTNDTSNTSKSPDNSLMDEEQCKFIINVFKSNDDDLHSQNEETLLKIAKKYEKHFIPLNNETVDLNTQTYMDLLLEKANVDLQKLQDVSKNQTIEHMDSDDIVIATPPSTSKECSSKQNNQDVITDEKYQDQDQDSDLIAFKTMCDALLKITAVDTVTLNSSANTKKNNQENPLILEQVNADVLRCKNNRQCVPSTSNWAIDTTCSESDTDITKDLAHKKHIFRNVNSSEESSPEYLNEVSQKQYSCQNKKIKLNKKTNTNDLKKVNTFVKKEENGIFYYAPDGKVHQDMLAFIDKQKYGC